MAQPNLFTKATDATRAGLLKVLKLIQIEHEMDLRTLTPTQLAELDRLLLDCEIYPEIWGDLGKTLILHGRFLCDLTATPLPEGTFPVAPVPPAPVPASSTAPPPLAATKPVAPSTFNPGVKPASDQPRPEPPAPQPPPRVAAPMPAEPLRSWVPRERPEIEKTLNNLAARLHQLDFSGEAGVLRLKALGAEFRRCLMENEVHQSLGAVLQDVGDKFRAAVDQYAYDQFLVPLRFHIRAESPDVWHELALRYQEMVPAWEALTWLEEHHHELKPPEIRNLLECCNAVQQACFRCLDQGFERSRDDHQRAMYAMMMRLVETYRLRLNYLTAPSSQEEQHLRKAVPEVYRNLKESLERRIGQERSLQEVLALVESVKFGRSTKADRPKLHAALREAFQQGVVISNKQLRDALLPFGHLLKGEADFAPLLQDIEAELTRRGGAVLEEGEGEEEEDELSLDLRLKLDELLPYTRGRSVLFLGGTPIEGKRVALQEILQLKELHWPQTSKRATSVADFEADIRNADITVLLIRFMRSGFEQAKDIAKKYDHRLVRLPRGLGVSRIIQDFHDQLVPVKNAS